MLLLLWLIIIDFITTNPQRQFGFIIAVFHMPRSHNSLNTVQRIYYWTVGGRTDRYPPYPQTQALGEQWVDMPGMLDLSSQPALNRLIIEFAWFLHPAHIDISNRGHPWESKSQTSITTCATDLGEQSCFGCPEQWERKAMGLSIHLSDVL